LSNDAKQTTVPQYVIEREVPGAGALSEAQLRDLSLQSDCALGRKLARVVFET